MGLSNRLKRPRSIKGWAAFGVVGALFLAAFTWGFDYTVQATNQTSFCISCHSMQGNYEEYKASTHYSNRAGVRVQCSDCHVAKEFGPKMFAKVVALKDVYHELAGTVDTPEKFEERRLHMAELVWGRMKASDSRECRNCHAFDAMKIEEQGRMSGRRHKRAIEEGTTCIECHQGLVHDLPKGFTRN